MKSLIRKYSKKNNITRELAQPPIETKDASEIFNIRENTKTLQTINLCTVSKKLDEK